MLASRERSDELVSRPPAMEAFPDEGRTIDGVAVFDARCRLPLDVREPCELVGLLLEPAMVQFFKISKKKEREMLYIRETSECEVAQISTTSPLIIWAQVPLLF